jgi:2-polyprenyl-6-methoxyphenol hydroxylase-like FAD-dependent oxidoreductase
MSIDPKLLRTETRTVRKGSGGGAQKLNVDICVVGSGAAGTSAALEAAALGRKVALIDGLPSLGGQAVNSIIGIFVGFFSNGDETRKPYQLTHGIADRIFKDLGAKGALDFREGPMTTNVMYDEVALQRWIEEAIRAAGIVPIVGAIVRDVVMEGRRVRELELATRYGEVRVSAEGFVDASGDAALAWQAGLRCHEAEEGPIYGTQMVVLENIDATRAPSREAFAERVAEKHRQYGFPRRDGFAFVSPGRGIALVNMTHIETPLDPIAMSRIQLEGKAQADKVIAFLKAEYPECFAKARVRAFGQPGVRQTRWIVGTHQLTADEVRSGTKFPDAIARCTWPIELHSREEGYVWEPFGPDHMHYVPLGSLAVADADNLMAAGRCIDGDAAALSSVRVMGPCMAMGKAAANALDLAGAGSVHQIDIAALRDRLKDNLVRTD